MNNKKEIKNGKGDLPRNISKKFRENYDNINWKYNKDKNVEVKKKIKYE